MRRDLGNACTACRGAPLAAGQRSLAACEPCCPPPAAPIGQPTSVPCCCRLPPSRLWGAQTQRSIQNFKIGGPSERMPEPVVRAFGVLKGAAAKVNMDMGVLYAKIGSAVVQVRRRRRLLLQGVSLGNGRGAYSAGVARRCRRLGGQKGALFANVCPCICPLPSTPACLPGCRPRARWQRAACLTTSPSWSGRPAPALSPT